MKLYTGDRIIDHRGRELCLSHRASVAGRKGWLAYPVRREKVQRGHNAVFVLIQEVSDGKLHLHRTEKGASCALRL